MAYNSAYTGAQIDAAIGAVRGKEDTWDNKADLVDGKVPLEQLPDMSFFSVASTAPVNTSLLWIDTSTGGVIKYYDAASGAWKATLSVWGEG